MQVYDELLNLTVDDARELQAVLKLLVGASFFSAVMRCPGRAGLRGKTRRSAARVVARIRADRYCGVSRRGLVIHVNV